MNEYLAQGGEVTYCRAYLRKYVFSTEGLAHAEKLAKRVKRGLAPSDVQAGRIFLGLISKDEAKENSKKEAQQELTWWRHRAMPKQYEPKGDKRCDPHSIRSNTSDYEDRFLDRVGIREEGSEGELLDDVLTDEYGHDYMEFEEGNTGHKPSVKVHALVAPDITNSLDRLFGQEMYPEEASLDGASAELTERWNAELELKRRKDKKEREAWRKLIARPS